MAEVLLLCVRFDDTEVEDPSPGAVTVHHPSGRRFVITEITDAADAADTPTSIW